MKSQASPQSASAALSMRRIQAGVSPSETECTGSRRANADGEAASPSRATTSWNCGVICLKPYAKVTLPETASVSP